MKDKFISIQVRKKVEETVSKDGSDNKEKTIITNLSPDDYPQLYLDHEISKDEFNDAIDVIITACMQKDMNTVIVNLDQRLEALNPKELDEPVKMTMDDIERELGHKIQIIN